MGLYRRLGLDKDASLEDIRESALSRQTESDPNANPNTEENPYAQWEARQWFKAIGSTLVILGNKELRGLYDTLVEKLGEEEAIKAAESPETLREAFQRQEEEEARSKAEEEAKKQEEEARLRTEEEARKKLEIETPQQTLEERAKKPPTPPKPEEAGLTAKKQKKRSFLRESNPGSMGLYQRLGLDKDASPETLQENATARLIEADPVANPGNRNAEEWQSAITSAVLILGNKELKPMYDTLVTGLGEEDAVRAAASEETLREAFKKWQDGEPARLAEAKRLEDERKKKEREDKEALERKREATRSTRIAGAVERALREKGLLGKIIIAAGGVAIGAAALRGREKESEQDPLALNAPPELTPFEKLSESLLRPFAEGMELGKGLWAMRGVESAHEAGQRLLEYEKSPDAKFMRTIQSGIKNEGKKLEENKKANKKWLNEQKEIFRKTGDFKTYHFEIVGGYNPDGTPDGTAKVYRIEGPRGR